MADLKYDPPKAFTEKAWIKSYDEYKKMYDRSLSDPSGILGRNRREFLLVQKMGQRS